MTSQITTTEAEVLKRILQDALRAADDPEFRISLDANDPRGLLIRLASKWPNDVVAALATLQAPKAA